MLKLLNDNQGIIAVIGLFFVIPFAIISDRMLSNIKDKKQRKELKKILIKELWININFVAQIERSINNQLNDLNNLHIPHYPPRTHIINKFFEYSLLSSLDMKTKESIIEVYEQLEDLKQEFFCWKTHLNNRYVIEPKWYECFSSTILSYVQPTMTNLIDLWALLVKDIGSKSGIPQIQELNEIILHKIKEGKWIRTSYKSSYYNKPEFVGIEKFDVIMCWENDWKDTDKEVIELKNIIAIFDSWKDTV